MTELTGVLLLGTGVLTLLNLVFGSILWDLWDSIQRQYRVALVTPWAVILWFAIEAGACMVGNAVVVLLVYQSIKKLTHGG